MSGELASLLQEIPHRPPVLCIDAVAEVSADHAVAERLVSEGDLWEEGFIEGLAQTAAVFQAQQRRTTGYRSARTGMLVEVRRFQIARCPRLGEKLLLRVDLVRWLPPLTSMRGEVLCGGETLARGELKFFIEEVP